MKIWDNENFENFKALQESTCLYKNMIVSSARRVQLADNTTSARKINYDLPENYEISEEGKDEWCLIYKQFIF